MSRRSLMLNKTQRAALTWTTVLLAVLVAALAWWWPALSGQSSQLDVLVLGNGHFADSREVIERRLREDGFSVRWADGIDGWCDAAEDLPQLLAQDDPQRVVASFVGTDDCPDGAKALVGAAGGHRVFVAVQPGRHSEEEIAAILALDADGLTVVDPSTLLSPIGTDAVCLWWDECRPEGLVAIRGVDGRLTAGGAQRVVRSLLAAMR